MGNIEKYTKQGKTFYKFKVYTGINPKTGKKSQTTRSGFTTKAAATAERRKIQADVADGTYWEDKNDDAPKTLGDLFDEYIEMRKPSSKPATIKSMRRSAKDFSKIKDYKITEISPKNIQNVLKEKNAQSSTKNVSLSFIRRCFDYARDMGYVTNSPVASIEPFKDFEVKEEKFNFYDENELRAFLGTLKESNFKYYVLFRLAAFSGLRIGEICALKWGNVDFEKNTIEVKGTVTVSDKKIIVVLPKTTTSLRTVEMDKVTMSILKQWNQLTPGTVYLFEGRNPGRPTNPVYINSFLRYFFKTHPNLKVITPHGLRHTHASLLFKNGVNPKIIQKRLGHATLDMTLNVYTHLFKDFENDEVTKLLNTLENDFKDD